MTFKMDYFLLELFVINRHNIQKNIMNKYFSVTYIFNFLAQLCCQVQYMSFFKSINVFPSESYAC